MYKIKCCIFESLSIQTKNDFPSTQQESVVVMKRMSNHQHFLFNCTFSVFVCLHHKWLTDCNLNHIQSSSYIYIDVQFKVSFDYLQNIILFISAAVVRMKRSMPKPPQRFQVEHPFLFILTINQEQNRISLFQGTIRNLQPTISHDEL